jgi:dual oxidase
LNNNTQGSMDSSESATAKATNASCPPSKYRRVDFHRIVRDRNYLLWFSDLLNLISSTSSPAAQPRHSPNLDIRIQTPVTQKRKNISTHIFRFLLEQHRTETNSAFPLTRLLNPTHIGRPDLGYIMGRHYADMQELLKSKRCNRDGDGSLKVGVLLCGASAVGHELADRCRLLTARGRENRSLIEYRLMMEISG